MSANQSLDGGARAQRGLDHLVLPVRDLDAARRRYTAMGFTLTPTAAHPWGTGNFLVQLRGNFLEVLGILDAGRIEPHGPGQFSFGAFNRDFLRKREGFSMLVFEGHDARADRQEFAESGLQTYAPFDFERPAKLPDGSASSVAFSLTFVTDPGCPEAAFFTCQQHKPEVFWRPEYQKHPNGVLLCSEAIMVAPHPAGLEKLFTALQGRDALSLTPEALTVATARGKVSIMTPTAFAERFPNGTSSFAPETPYLAGFQVTVRSLSDVVAVLDAGGAPPRGGGARLWLPPQEALGVVIEFVE